MFKKIFLVLLSLIVISKCYKYETKWFRVPLDHFGYQRNETFQIKYLENNESWDEGGGPIFFYTGNEGQIEQFAKYTGFIWENAAQFKAKIVFAEHRYYGASMPFGNKSLENKNIGYLTSAQALADYAALVNYLQGDVVVPKYPVIAFGGSYGGMLAAYFRIKYPHVVIGAVAASAPIHMYPKMAPCELFAQIATSSYSIINKSCPRNIRDSWAVIRNFTSNSNSSEWLQKNWNLCDPVKNNDDVETLVSYLSSMYDDIAMVNYPFEADFLIPLPANPVEYVCQFLNTTLTGQNLVEAIGKVVKVYGNYKNDKKCIDYKNGDSYANLDASGWDYQTCTEMVMPMCTTGKDDMYEPRPWNFTEYAADCHKKYNVYPQEDGGRIQYGGDLLQAASNIVFSNGLLDPWTGGGILSGVNYSLKAIVIPDAAHHLDLMPSNPADPSPVLSARATHRQLISSWIEQFRAQRRQMRIPKLQ